MGTRQEKWFSFRSITRIYSEIIYSSSFSNYRNTSFITKECPGKLFFLFLRDPIPPEQKYSKQCATTQIMHKTDPQAHVYVSTSLVDIFKSKYSLEYYYFVRFESLHKTSFTLNIFWKVFDWILIRQGREKDEPSSNYIH